VRASEPYKILPYLGMTIMPDLKTWQVLSFDLLSGLLHWIVARVCYFQVRLCLKIELIGGLLT
jgi:hypothetical protein